MDNNIKLLIFQVIIILVLSIVIIYLIRQNISIRFERRIGRYSISPLKSKDKSVMEIITSKYHNLIIKLRKYISSIFLFRIISKKYDKYITYGEADNISAIDFVTQKLFIATSFVLLTIFSQVLQTRVVTIIELIINFCIGYYILDIYMYYHHKMKLKKMESQILKAVIIMNNAFKAGKSTIQAVEIAKNKLEYPLNVEFKKIYNDIKYGLSIEVVFQRFAKRVDIKEVKYLSSSLTILNKTGGNIVEVFSSIEKSLFDNKKLKEELRNLTVSTNLVVKILMFLPFILVMLIYILNKDYFNPLFTSILGYVVLVLIFTILIMYIYFLEKIMKVKV